MKLRSWRSSRSRVLTLLPIRALLRLRHIIHASLLGSYMRQSACITGRVNIGQPQQLHHHRLSFSSFYMQIADRLQ